MVSVLSKLVIPLMKLFKCPNHSLKPIKNDVNPNFMNILLF